MGNDYCTAAAQNQEVSEQEMDGPAGRFAASWTLGLALEISRGRMRPGSVNIWGASSFVCAESGLEDVERDRFHRGRALKHKQ